MKFLIVILFFIPGICTGQLGGNAAGSQSVGGEILIPALQSIKVEMLENAPVKFEKPEDFYSPRVITGFCRITVISNVPWVVNVSSSSPYFSEKTGRGTTRLAAGLASLRGNLGDFFSPLSNTPSPVLKSDNERIKNVYLLDLRINPAERTEGGKYMAELIFTISPE